MPRIAISYRRSDTAGITGRVFDRLERHFGEGSVFMDIDAIPLGVDFRKYIASVLHSTDFLLVMMGAQWLGPRDHGGNRIDDPTDPVRLEVEAAIRADTLVIPVLVDGISMPSAELLPEAMKDFAFINAAQLDSGKDFNNHVDRLVRFLDATIAARKAAEEAEARKKNVAVDVPTNNPPAEEEPAEDKDSSTIKDDTTQSGDNDKVLPPTPWYRRWTTLAAGLVAAAIIALATHVSPPQPPDSNPTATPSTEAATATPFPKITLPPGGFGALGTLSAHPLTPIQLTPTDWTCPMKSPKLADLFSSHNAAWNPLTAGADIGFGFMNITQKANSSSWDLHDGHLGNVTLCTKLFNTPTSSQTTQPNSGAGLAFWSGYLHGNADPVIYGFFVSPSGYYAIWRFQHQQWTAMLSPAHSDAVVTGPNAQNVLTAVLHGNDAAFYINGHSVGSIRAAGPHGSFAGVIAETSRRDSGPVTWRFGYYAYR